MATRYNNTHLNGVMIYGQDFYALKNDPHFKVQIRAIAVRKQQAFQLQEDATNSLAFQTALQDGLDIETPNPEENQAFDTPFKLRPLASARPDLFALLLKRQTAAVKTFSTEKADAKQHLSDLLKTHGIVLKNTDLTLDDAAAMLLANILDYSVQARPAFALKKEQHNHHLHMNELVQHFFHTHTHMRDNQTVLISTLGEQACDMYDKHMEYRDTIAQCNAEYNKLDVEQKIMENAPLPLAPSGPQTTFVSHADERQHAQEYGNKHSTPNPFEDQINMASHDKEEEAELQRQLEEMSRRRQP